MIEAVFFYAFSAVLLFSAVMVISARNPVHAVLWLILAFFNAAGLFVMLGAEFLAMILVIVYVGAVAVLFLFVVMMLDIKFTALRGGMRKHAPVGAAVGGILMAEMIGLYRTAIPDVTITVDHPTPDILAVPNARALGEILYTDYVYLFEVSGLILLVAMIGAITLTHRGRGDARRQNISSQVHRRAKDVLKIEKIKSGAGVS